MSKQLTMAAVRRHLQEVFPYKGVPHRIQGYYKTQDGKMHVVLTRMQGKPLTYLVPFQDLTEADFTVPPAEEKHPSGLSGEHDVVLDAIHSECLHGRE